MRLQASRAPFEWQDVPSPDRPAGDAIGTPKEIINDARNGRMFLLVDDLNDTAEGYLVIPAQMATPQAMDFMASHGRGLVRLALTGRRAEQLGLPKMAKRDGTRNGEDFAVSIKSRDGVVTATSTADRARTVAVAIDGAKTSNDIVTPGDVFPVVAVDGGLLVRAAPVEAAVDIARQAGLNSSGVICGVLDQNGAMASLSDLIAFAHDHRLRIGLIRDLVVHRLRCDRNVACAAQVKLESRHGGEWLVKTYVNNVDDAEHLVLQKGAIDHNRPALVRMHPGSLLPDILGEERSGSGDLYRAMDVIAEEGAGVIVIFRDTAPSSLSSLLAARTKPVDVAENHGVGAQILADLGIDRVVLLTGKPCRALKITLEHYGFDVLGERQMLDSGETSTIPQ